MRPRLLGGVAAALAAWIVGGAVTAPSRPARAQDAPPALSRDLGAQFAPGVRRDGVLFVLAIGSDARLGEAVAGMRADSLHIIGVNSRRRSASILGIPRDAFVAIPGAGSSKINASLFFGGPERTVDTVERLTGIRMDAYLLTGFEDFRGMVTEVGGVRIEVPYAMSDAASGAFFKPGHTRMDGPAALAFARNRHDAPGGDFGRSLNHGRLIVAALHELRDDLRRDPMTLMRWLAAGARSIRTDLGLGEMLELLLAATSIEPGRVRNRVVSGSAGTVGGASVVHLGSSAEAAFRDLGRDGILGN